jgi:hypothetical protein
MHTDRVEQVREIPFMPEVLVTPDPEGQWFVQLLLMRKQLKKFPEAEPLVTLYERTGKRKRSLLG